MLTFFDTETTGLEEQDRVLEVAYASDNNPTKNMLFKPPVPINIGAMATHHITEKMVKDQPIFAGSDIYKFFQEQKDYLIAHNAVFDVKMLKKEGIILDPNKVICTLKLIAHADVDSEIEGYSLQYLRYYFGIELYTKTHSVNGDVDVLREVYNKVIELLPEEDRSFDRQVEISKKPMLIRKIKFGKHKGKLMEDVPADYLMWLLNQPDLDEDLLYTINHYLNR